MTLRADEEYILFKLNPGAYGSTDAPSVPAALNAIAVSDVAYTQQFTKEAIAESLGIPGEADEQTLGGYQELSFKVYVRGAADLSPDTPIPAAPLLRAAGHSETITPDEKVEYLPVTDALEHGTLYYYIGGTNGVLHKMIGVRLMVKLVQKVGALDVFEFTALGLDVDPEPAVALPAVDWSGLKTQLPTLANTVQTMTLFGQPVGMATMSTTFGNKYGHLHVTNQEAIDYEGRSGMVDISILEPSPALINYWTKARKGDQGALVFQRGKSPAHVGNILKQDIPNLRLSSVARRKDAGRLYLDLKLVIKPLTKNSDYTITTM